MGFHEVRFPADISFGSTGGPEFSTDIVEVKSGFEQRNVNWAEARAKYNVAHGVKTKEQLQELISFFRARRGRAFGFRFKDWADFSGVSELVGVGNGTNTEFQLVKKYQSGAYYVSRQIKKPVQTSVKIYLNGVQQNSGWAVDEATGVVEFVVAPANGVEVTADFEFDVPARFDTDKLSARLDDYGVHSWNDIPIVEVRV